MERKEFVKMMLKRTSDVAIRIVALVNTFPQKTAYFVIAKQILKSATSTAANWYKSAITKRILCKIMYRSRRM